MRHSTVNKTRFTLLACEEIDLHKPNNFEWEFFCQLRSVPYRPIKCQICVFIYFVLFVLCTFQTLTCISFEGIIYRDNPISARNHISKIQLQLTVNLCLNHWCITIVSIIFLCHQQGMLSISCLVAPVFNDHHCSCYCHDKHYGSDCHRNDYLCYKRYTNTKLVSFI